MRLHAANASDFDRERFCSFGCGQRATRQRQRHFVADLVILCAANDLPLAFSISHAANGELVRIGVFVAGNDLGDNDTIKLTPGLVESFHFNTEHCQMLRQLFGGPGEVDVLLEPIQRYFHRKKPPKLSRFFNLAQPN